MKLTKKLIPAIGMLMLSAVMLVTSSFAWFAMNEKVSATGMSVTAKGDQVYLQIINPNSSIESEKAFTNGASQTTASANTEMKALLPVNVVNAINEPTGEGDEKVFSCTPYSGGATMKWVTNVGVSNSNGAASKQYDEVTSDYANYYLKNTFKLRLDPTAGAPSSPALRVAGINVNASSKDFQKCLSVLVVSIVKNTTDDAPVSTMGQVWEYDGGAFVNKTTAVTALSGETFSATTYAEVEIYVFFNGDNPNCTQAMLAQAAGIQYDVAVNFTVAKQN